MFVLFEEAGKYLGGRVLSEAEASAQVELETGKRLKVKAANIVLRFEKPAPAELIAQARALAAGMDLDLAWEFAPQEEFGFGELAADYFTAKPSLEQQAAALLALFDAPHYFRRAGKGRFRKAPAEIVQQALAAIEKKKQVQAQIGEWAAQLAAGECPAPVREQLYRILFKPDKNAPEYKAVVEASRAAQKPPLELLERAGAIDSPYQFHCGASCSRTFPGARASRRCRHRPSPRRCRWPTGCRLSRSTIRRPPRSTTRFRSRGWAPAPSPWESTSRHRAWRWRRAARSTRWRARACPLSYMPGHKITMLPDDIVAAYTLTEGRDCPAVSLYARFDAQTLAPQGIETRLERVPIVANLRHDQLDEGITEAWLDDASVSSPDLPQAVSMLRGPLSFLYRLARHLKAGREAVRGKPESFNRPDFNFRLAGGEGEPTGDETVQISTRRRGAPLDLIVSEAMILANSSWGRLAGRTRRAGALPQPGEPGARHQGAHGHPGTAARGLGVRSYAWSTSPLRRYTDLVNQWQIIAAARHGRTAALAAPFKPKDADLFSILSGFEAAYSTYNAYQGGMERFWTLKYLQQQGIRELDATVIKDQPNAVLVRADTLPLVFPAVGAQGLARGARVRVALGEIDEIALDVRGTVVAHLDDAASRQQEDEPEEEEAAGPLAIAVDVSEADPTEPIAA